MSHTRYLKTLRACEEAVEWASQYPTLQAAWEACERGDWMLWLLGKSCGNTGSEKHKQVVLLACKCARLALKHVPRGEDRPRIAIETAERWTRGAATLEEVRDAYYYAYDAADSAAHAAYYAYDAAYYAYDAYYYAYYAAYYAYYYAYYAADRQQVLGECAGIVRTVVPNIDEWLERRASDERIYTAAG